MKDDLRRHALATPDKLALVMSDGADRRSYADLDAAADAMAGWFHSTGLKAGDTIALLLENRLEVVEIWWAARRAGLYYAPLSVHFRAGEILHVLRDSDVRLLITSARFADVAAAVANELQSGEVPHRVVLDGPIAGFEPIDPARWQGLPEPAPAALYGREFIYSSGTTGRPKGVRRPLAPYPHADRLPLFEQVVRRMFRARPGMIFLSTSPLYHSLGRFVMRTIEVGGTSVILPSFDAEAALAAIDRFSITHSLWVPTMFVRLLALPDAVRARYAVSSLELALHAAAPCPVPVKRAMIDWFGLVVDEFYGGTENAGVTFLTAAEWLDHVGSVGRSVTGAIHILSEDGQESELPTGEIGAVYFEGGVPFTYHNDAGKSREAFSSRGWGTYGDIGHVDADGYLYLSDRRTDLIISGGVNIYPSEVEATLLDHPAVAEVAVIGLPEPEFGQKVVAVIRAIPGSDIGEVLAAGIKVWARERLSGLKCPRDVHFVEALPVNEHGKLLKRVLRERFARE